LVTIADRWLQEHPDDWHMLLYRGRGQQLMGAREKAQDDFERVLALRPGQQDAQVWLSSVLMLDGHFEQARKYFAAACEQRPEDANARFGLAYCAFHLGDSEVALEHLNRLLRTDPTSARALLLRGRIALADGNCADAIRWLAKAEAVSPGQTDITQAYADALRQAGRLQEAQRYNQKANKILALAGALERTEQRIWQKPEDVALRCQAAELNLKLHHDKEALRWLDSVLKTDPVCTTAHGLLAQYYERQGNQRQAAYHRQRAGKAPQAKSATPTGTHPPPPGSTRPK
ncbi:MAG TPA: tetratricopeptide repeat protein, partial [Gemmataceae bacterium]|nr:tetratricopeptide repeat protein [Gemmataceae bacterium]